TACSGRGARGSCPPWGRRSGRTRAGSPARGCRRAARRPPRRTRRPRPASPSPPTRTGPATGDRWRRGPRTTGASARPHRSGALPSGPRRLCDRRHRGKGPRRGCRSPHPSTRDMEVRTVATAHAGGYAGPSRIHSLAQYGAFAFGAVFVLVGILGFIPGITTNVDDMTFAGEDSGAELLGIFQVSVLHNLVHLLLGIVGLWAARLWATARVYLLATGVVYLALFVYGMVIDRESDANFVPLNSADDWLHLVLAVAMLAVGLAAGRRFEDDPLVRGRGDVPRARRT